MDFFDTLNDIAMYTPLGEWTLPVVLSLILVLILVVVLYYTSEARKIKYRFITVGSHKLRTPLSKIKVAVAELVEKAEAARTRKETFSIGEYEERMLHQIVIENNRLIGLVNLLLEVSESEVGHAKYERSSFDIIALTREILVGYQNSQWRNDRVFIELEADERELFVHADKRRIGSVIQVLLENAITYSPSGGKIVVSLKRDKRRIVMSVVDTGMGITAAEQRYIFKKFWRSSRALHINTEGTGIGLFLAQHIVEGHGGKMWFTSDGEYQGSAFFFTLPAGNLPPKEK